MTIDLNRPIIQSVQFNRKAELVRTRENTGNTNPTSHLSLAKIGETDVIGQSSSIVFGVAKAFAPHTLDRRWLAFLKGREGEGGTFQIRYEFSPVNFGLVSIGAEDNSDAERPNLSHMT